MSPTLAQITRELLASYNRLPRKRLGQHFLVDPKVLKRILAAAEINPGDHIIEIGSGLGIVTAELAKTARQVTAIEIDKELVRISRDVLIPFRNINFISQDILKVDLAKIASGQSYKIVGNLPYYITAPIIDKILKSGRRSGRAVLMVQKEVAERMIAVPGSKKYGSFSIFTQFYAKVTIDSYVSKSSFHPWPEVGSAIVVLVPYATPKYAVKDEKSFFNMVHAAFQQRRKKIRNSLAKYNLDSCQFDLTRRPEELTIEEFVRIYYNSHHEAKS